MGFLRCFEEHGLLFSAKYEVAYETDGIEDIDLLLYYHLDDDFFLDNRMWTIIFFLYQFRGVIGTGRDPIFPYWTTILYRAIENRLSAYM